MNIAMRIPCTVRKLLLCLLTTLLASCSMVNIAYNHADTVVYWYLDDYFDFNSDQREMFDQGAQRIHVWHRRVEVPKYAALSAEAALRVEAGLTKGDLDWLENQLRTRFDVLAKHSAGDLATLLVTMDSSQLGALDKKFAKSNTKFIKEHLSGTLEQRERKRVKESLARIEEWIGDLKPDQETSIAAMLKAMPRMGEHRYVHRLARQKAIREILAARLDRDELQVALNDWMINWESGRTAEHQRLWGRWVEQNRQLLLKLSTMLTPRQRAHLIKKLRDFAEDFNRLHDQQG